MSISDRTDDRQVIRRRSAPDGPPALRRGREHRIVRWISAGNRKAPPPAEETTSAAPDCHVIKLSWADTFGRQDRAALGRSVPGPAQVLPFQSRKAESAPSPGSRRAADQPPVPVLR